ncbi:MAG: AraC family transcriptional regulator [Gemmatimonadales bacterium]
MSLSCPPPDASTGFAARRAVLPRGLDFLAITLSGHEFPRHVHEGYTIGLVLGGALEYWCAGETRRYRPGSTFFLNPGEVHTGRASPGHGAARYQIVFPRAELVEALIGFQPRLRRFGGTDRSPRRHFRELASLAVQPGTPAARASARPDPDGGEARLGYLLRVLLADGSVMDRGLEGRRAHLADQVRRFLLGNLQGRPSLDQLAAHLGLHPGYLRRVFTEETGLSPRSYLVQLRVMRARQLLGRGEPIARVVPAAGFADQAHLTHEFKRTMGSPPGRFQAELGYR